MKIHQLRDYTHDRHKTVDDRPFGGGPGMLLKPEPIFEAVEAIARETTRVILLSPAGRPIRVPQYPRDKYCQPELKMRGAHRTYEERTA